MTMVLLVPIMDAQDIQYSDKLSIRKNKIKKGDVILSSFELLGGLMLVEGELWNQKDSFVIDTGAPYLVINSDFYISNLDGVTAGGISGAASAQLIDIDQFSLGEYQVDDFSAFVMDLSHIEKVKNRKIKGLIGADILSNYEMLIDYDNKLLTMFKPRTTEYHTDVYPLDEIPFELYGHFPVISVKIGKKQYKLGIDTGAEVNLLNTASIDKEDFKNLGATVQSKKLHGVDKEKKTVACTKISNSMINGEVYDDMEFILTDISFLNNAYGIKLDGLLGFPFLKSKKFSINFKKKKLYVWGDFLDVDKQLPLTLSEKE